LNLESVKNIGKVGSHWKYL